MTKENSAGQLPVALVCLENKSPRLRKISNTVGFSTPFPQGIFTVLSHEGDMLTESQSLPLFLDSSKNF